MEQALMLNNNGVLHYLPEEKQSSSNSFINANTIDMSLHEIKTSHILPVFVKDNEPLISQAEFVESVANIVSDVYHGEHILKPAIRVSHPIKGRVPDAKDKPASMLQEWEKTIYYERMMFAIEIPSITENIDGNTLSLTVGGVKSYNLDNLYNRKGVDEHFKFFVGFQNKVCTNYCISGEGYVGDLRAKNVESLRTGIYQALSSYNPVDHIRSLDNLSRYSLTEKQFANLLGRCRMYNYLSTEDKQNIPRMLYGDQQLNAVCKDFYKDESFCKDNNGNINLWRMYNLFTGSNKSSYIDSFLDRSVNAFQFADQLCKSLDNQEHNWFLN